MSSSINFSHFSLNQVDKKSHFPESIATVWLLSTLGGSTSRISSGQPMVDSTTSSSSSVKKKDIINVSIPDTCTIIQNNEMQLPLRYVSNLLYGVTVCYNRKTEYVLNDLTSLLTQLQKRIYSSEGRSNQKKHFKHDQKGRSSTTIFNFSENDASNGLLRDDPLFDISHIGDFEQALGIAPTNEASTIRKQDYLRELTNWNAFEKPVSLEQSGSLEHMNRSISLDDIAVDVDFNLDVEDIMSQEGTGTTRSSVDSSTLRGNNDFTMNFDNQDFTLNFEDDGLEANKNNEQSRPVIEPDIPLEIPEEEQDRERMNSLERENDDNFPPLKKFKSGKVFGSAVTTVRLIQVDERTSLSTDVLKNNHNNYCEIMENKQKREGPKPNFNSLKELMNIEREPGFLQRCWNFVLDNGVNTELQFLHGSTGFDSDSIERGRNRSGSHSNSERSSSNVSSEEIGRRMMISRDNSIDYNANEDLLLGLEQINEELEGDSSRATSTHQQDFMQMNLELPPSSFGRTNTRTRRSSDIFSGGSSAGNEPDAVDVLYQKTRGSAHRRNDHGESLNNLESREPSEMPSSLFNDHEHEFVQLPFRVVLDYQTRKFYDYIRETSLFMGKNTRSTPPFKKKILFEDIVPSKLTTQKDVPDHENRDREHEARPIISRRIAANAFLSLLNLASKELIGIKEYERSIIDNDFKVRRGDDIVVYV